MIYGVELIIFNFVITSRPLYHVYDIPIPAFTRYTDPMLVLCWSGVTSQQIQNICRTFVQRRTNVFDVGPTLYKCSTNVLSLLVYDGPTLN